MEASGHRFSAVPVAIGAIGLAFCVASACGGAAGSPLDHPPGSGTQAGDDSSAGSLDAQGGSSSGGAQQDATLADDSNPGDDTASDAAGGQGGDDVGTSPPVTGPDASSLCAPCVPGARCCTMPGTFSYGQCYSVLCGACCF